jgi:hypothetical protein
VLDTVALTAGGYQDICTTFYDYELSIPQNGTISMAGAVANLNKHSVSLDMRLVSGIGVQLGLTGQTSDVTLTAAFSRQKKENLTPLAITDVITITNLNADTAVVRCILPGLEESAFCTSRIAPAADTAASQTRAASVPSASTSGVFPSTGQDFAILLTVNPSNNGDAAARYMFGAGSGAYTLRVYYSALETLRFLQVVPEGTAYSGNTVPQVAGDNIQILAIKTILGLASKTRVYNSGAWQAWSAWAFSDSAAAKANTVVGPTYNIGCAFNGVTHLPGNYPRTAIIAMPPKATLAEYQAWIEAELTRRGLIGDDNDDFPYSLPFTLE